ncbi:MAG: hypothetical protein V4590_03150 [Bacteroidota bacterium]
MKKILISLKIALLVCCMQPVLLNAQETEPDTRTYEWKRAKHNKWPGVADKQTYWSKFGIGGELWTSADGKNWQKDGDGMWSDKEAVFYKFDGDKLMASRDGGTTWTESIDWKWHAIDGKWYKVDKERNVWVSK